MSFLSQEIVSSGYKILCITIKILFIYFRKRNLKPRREYIFYKNDIFSLETNNVAYNLV